MKNLILIISAVALLSSYISAQNCIEAAQHVKNMPTLVSTVRNNFDDQAIGQVYDFDLKPVLLNGLNASVLSFDLAYSYFPGRYDSLRILVSTDCGKSWNTIFYTGGEELSTVTPSTDYFIPQAGDFKNFRIDLFHLYGPLTVRFRFINGNGNNLYLDNAGITDALAASKNIRISTGILYPNPFSENATLQLDQPVEDGTLLIIDSLGREINHIQNVTGDHFQLDGKNLMAGLYFYFLYDAGLMQSEGRFSIAE